MLSRGPNKKHSEERITKMGEATGIAVEVFDKQTNETTSYYSGRQAAKALNCSGWVVRTYIKSQNLYKGRYQFKIKSK